MLPGMLVILAFLLPGSRSMLAANGRGVGKSSRSAATGPAARASRRRVLGLAAAYRRRRAAFEVNLGQTNRRVLFLSRGSGYTLFLTTRAAVLLLQRARMADAASGSETAQSPARGPAVLRMRLIGANGRARIFGLDELPGKSNYFVGSDPAHWQTNVPTYSRVEYQDVYPGTSLTYYGRRGSLEYDFVIAPDHDPGRISLGITSSQADGGLRDDSSGDIVTRTPAGELRFLRPVAYQPPSTAGGIRTRVSCKYVFKSNHRIGFELGRYDRSRPLVIDPVFSYSTYLGGSENEQAFGVAVDGSGDAYVTGNTDSVDFPSSSGSVPIPTGSTFAFVAKLNATGSALIYSAFMGGTGATLGYGIAVDSSGNAYVTGSTTASDFPITGGAYQTSCGFDSSGSCGNAFVAKLGPSGSTLIYATFLGGSGGTDDAGTSIAVDQSGNAYVAGSAGSAKFPTTPGAALVPTSGNTGGCFLTKLNSTGSGLVYSTFCGGLGFPSSFPTVAIDSSGDAYVATDTNVSTAPNGVPNSAVNFSPAPSGTYSALAVKFNATGSGFIYYDFFAGPQAEPSHTHDIAVDSSGDAYVTGSTQAMGFPTTPGVIQPTSLTSATNENAFIVKLDPTGTQMLYSAVFGGSGSDYGLGLAVDSSGDAYVSGATSSANFPITAGAPQAQLGGESDAFLMELNPAATQELYSTFIGGSANDAGFDAVVALDSAGSAFVAGDTLSPNFPTTSGAVQATPPPCINKSPPCSKAFITKVGPLPLVALSTSSLAFTGQIVSTASAAQTVTLSVSGESPLLVNSATASAGFAVTSACTNPVQPGTSCNLSVTFNPTAVGAATGTLTITDDAADSPQTVSLSGTGQNFSLASSSGSPSSVTVSPGQSATYTIALSSMGGFNQPVSLSCNGAPSEAACSVSPGSITLSGSVPVTVTATVSTTAAGMTGRPPWLPPPASGPRLWLAGLAALIALAGLMEFRRRISAGSLGKLAWSFTVPAILLAVLLMGGCGGGGGGSEGGAGGANLGTSAGTYSLTVTGTANGNSSTVTRSTNVTLVVQ